MFIFLWRTRGDLAFHNCKSGRKQPSLISTAGICLFGHWRRTDKEFSGDNRAPKMAVLHASASLSLAIRGTLFISLTLSPFRSSVLWLLNIHRFIKHTTTMLQMLPSQDQPQSPFHFAEVTSRIYTDSEPRLLLALHLVLTESYSFYSQSNSNVSAWCVHDFYRLVRFFISIFISSSNFKHTMEHEYWTTLI